jgi:low affinity Fe/Cu permease
MAHQKQTWFRHFAHSVSEACGSSASFGVAVFIIIVWMLSGPFFHFSDTWQLIINTGTTIITFLMVFLIQNTQNRDSKAIHLKLDELIHGVVGARNSMINLEELSDEELKKIQEQFAALKHKGAEVEARVESEKQKRRKPRT